MAEPSRAVLQAIAERTDPRVPYPVVLAIGERESRFDPDPPRGSSGEVGLMQILPRTLREELGYRGPLEALEGPEGVPRNIALGTRYLRILFDRWHTWPEAIRAWNGSGPAARAYAAGVLQRLPSWKQYVEANLEFFRTAQGKRTLRWGLAAAAAIVVLVLMAQARRPRELAA